MQMACCATFVCTPQATSDGEGRLLLLRKGKTRAFQTNSILLDIEVISGQDVVAFSSLINLMS